MCPRARRRAQQVRVSANLCAALEAISLLAATLHLYFMPICLAGRARYRNANVFFSLTSLVL